ncbi:hypothetical protein E2562_022760 [Oryza meyeriana var. granulata]|uniref:Uncharacterized protein n=1 Tax=Oryza meyeriana var. granulata TaxID=110450 RepID=A0A6G1FAY6_9ORYZ|nr:hypothetical protein E2562_022760 [Oryza meyeriana var. granulata]
MSSCLPFQSPFTVAVLIMPKIHLSKARKGEAVVGARRHAAAHLRCCAGCSSLCLFSTLAPPPPAKLLVIPHTGTTCLPAQPRRSFSSHLRALEGLET